jgi:hypothetical protein
MRLNEAWEQVTLNESAVKSLSRMLHHFSNHDIAIITAFRGKDINGNDVDKATRITRYYERALKPLDMDLFVSRELILKQIRLQAKSIL